MLDLKDNQDQTALHLATLCGHGETVDYLLQCGGKTVFKMLRNILNPLMRAGPDFRSVQQYIAIFF